MMILDSGLLFWATLYKIRKGILFTVCRLLTWLISWAQASRHLNLAMLHSGILHIITVHTLKWN